MKIQQLQQKEGKSLVERIASVKNLPKTLLLLGGLSYMAITGGCMSKTLEPYRIDDPAPRRAPTADYRGAEGPGEKMPSDPQRYDTFEGIEVASYQGE